MGGGKKLTSQFFLRGKNGPAQSSPPPITIIFGLEKVLPVTYQVKCSMKFLFKVSYVGCVKGGGGRN